MSPCIASSSLQRSRPLVSNHYIFDNLRSFRQKGSDELRVFLSHCVKQGDPVEIHKKKLDLINDIESAGHTVFDYAIRPGSFNEWGREIKWQLLACDCVVYFAKNLPEKSPGVCAMELGAANVLSKPILIYSPNPAPYRSVPIFEGGFEGIADAVRPSTILILTDKADVLRKIVSEGHRKGSESTQTQIYRAIHEAIVQHQDTPTSDLDSTIQFFKNLMNATLSSENGGLNLRRMTTSISVKCVGYFVHLELCGIVVVCKSASETKLCPYVIKNGVWSSQGDTTIDVDVNAVLDHTVTSGVIDGITNFLVFDGPNLILFRGSNRFLQTSALANELRNASRRSVVQSFTNSTGENVIGFYSDGKLYTVDVSGSIQRQSWHSNEQPSDFLVPSSLREPRRLTELYGGNDYMVYSEGGRVDGIFESTVSHEIGAVTFDGESLRLGNWKSINWLDLVTMLRDSDAFLTPKRFLNSDYTPLSKQGQNEDAIKKFLADAAFASTGYWNTICERPVVVLPDLVDRQQVFPHKAWQPGYHSLNLTWDAGLIEKIRNFLSGV